MHASVVGLLATSLRHLMSETMFYNENDSVIPATSPRLLSYQPTRDGWVTRSISDVACKYRNQNFTVTPISCFSRLCSLSILHHRLATAVDGSMPSEELQTGT